MKFLIRDKAIKMLNDFFKSKRSEFLAIYGRRRVGKTFLIKNYFIQQKCIFLPITGIQNGSFLDQRTACCQQISNIFFNGINITIPDSWLQIFEIINNAINSTSKKKIVVLFFDEFPWLATAKSRLLQALEYYWNQFWSNDKRVKLIICGSLASWIIKNIINNTGGLYNRVTYRLALQPFDLYETECFLKNNGVQLTDQQITSIYMVTGGIPLYLEQIKKGLSANQNIDRVCFSSNGLLTNEIEELFKSLFSNSDIFIKLTREIAKHRYGITKSDLSKILDISQSGRLVERLKELEDAGFIMAFLPYQHREKGMYFRVIDEYTLFYFRWIEPNLRSIRRLVKPKGFWLEKAQGNAYKSWCGYAFESICYKHINLIMRKLNLKPSALPFTWRYAPKKGDNTNGAQVDLLFDREDDAITLCEIKYTDSPFMVDKEYAQKLRKRIAIFKKKTRTKKQLFLALISANGLTKSMYLEDMVSGMVKLEDLFGKGE